MLLPSKQSNSFFLLSGAFEKLIPSEKQQLLCFNYFINVLSNNFNKSRDSDLVNFSNRLHAVPEQPEKKAGRGAGIFKERSYGSQNNESVSFTDVVFYACFLKCKCSHKNLLYRSLEKYFDVV